MASEVRPGAAAAPTPHAASKRARARVGAPAGSPRDVGKRAHVARALHVVLTAQWIDARALDADDRPVRSTCDARDFGSLPRVVGLLREGSDFRPRVKPRRALAWIAPRGRRRGGLAGAAEQTLAGPLGFEHEVLRDALQEQVAVRSLGVHRVKGFRFREPVSAEEISFVDRAR